ncbi:DUF1178 family protein [Devosia sp.]|uniref:DUF1178 family protein n=1 Tax=Devosia sp. TaxID=1871048 RepID=UPI0035ADB546
MITFALLCDNQHRFDAWFRSAEAFDEQLARGIVSCPVCASIKVEKALMAPAVARSGSDKVTVSSGHPQQAEIRELLRAMRRKVVSEADYVGDRFAEEARKIHFREADARGIYGEATRDEVAGLIDDGVDFLPLPNLPDEHN